MLTTVAEVEVFLGLTAPGAAVETVLDAMIDAAQKAMEGPAGAGRHLETATVTEIIDGAGGHDIWLNEPAQSITSIHESSDQTWTAATLISSDDYIDHSGRRACRVERPDSVWLNCPSGVRIIYTAGLAATVPDEIKFACWVQVAKLYSEWQVAKQGLNVLDSQAVEGWTQKFAAHRGLDPYVADVMKRYRPARL